MLLNGLQGLGCRVKLLDRIQGLSCFGVCGVLKGGFAGPYPKGPKLSRLIIGRVYDYWVLGPLGLWLLFVSRFSWLSHLRTLHGFSALDHLTVGFRKVSYTQVRHRCEAHE